MGGLWLLKGAPSKASLLLGPRGESYIQKEEMAMSKKEYLTFVENLESLDEGCETELLIKDLTPSRRKYDARYVRAMVSKDPGKWPEGDLLWIRGWVGVLFPDPWAIKIIAEVGEFPSGAGA